MTQDNEKYKNVSDDRKVKIRDQNGKIKYIKLSEIKQPPIKTVELDKDLLKRIGNVYEALKDVIMANSNPPMSLERFETMFMRSEKPELDVLIYERINKAYLEAQNIFGSNFQVRNQIYNILVFYALDALTEEEKQREDIKMIMKLFDTV